MALNGVLHWKVYSRPCKSSILGHSRNVASIKGQRSSSQVGFYIIPISWVFFNVAAQEINFCQPKTSDFEYFADIKTLKLIFVALKRISWKIVIKLSNWMIINDQEWTWMTWKRLKRIKKWNYFRQFGAAEVELSLEVHFR